jgi:hypothetical protein
MNHRIISTTTTLTNNGHKTPTLIPRITTLIRPTNHVKNVRRFTLKHQFHSMTPAH